MDCLVDTSILVRIALINDPLHSIANQAVSTLTAAGHTLYIPPQNLIEFRSVATRPVNVNGLGWTSSESEAEIAIFESMFGMLPDSPEVYTQWKTVVHDLGIVGVQVHDARLFAVALTNGVGEILTFNFKHFVRFQTLNPDFQVIDPSTVS